MGVEVGTGVEVLVGGGGGVFVGAGVAVFAGTGVRVLVGGGVLVGAGMEVFVVVGEGFEFGLDVGELHPKRIKPTAASATSLALRMFSSRAYPKIRVRP